MEIKNIFLEKVDSTNKFAKEHYKEFNSKNLTCILAIEQTNGYGRNKTKWVSIKEKSLTTTFCFTLPKDCLYLTSLAEIMSLSIAKVLIKEDVYPKLKWPNDILVNNKKISGVLCETIFEKENVHVFLGIGINVSLSEEDLKNISHPTTSLKIETGKILEIKNILKLLQDEFLINLKIFKKDGFLPFHCQYENLLAYKGEKVKCLCGQNEITGICHSINNEGMLNIYIPKTKEIKAINSGEIKYLRPI